MSFEIIDNIPNTGRTIYYSPCTFKARKGFIKTLAYVKTEYMKENARKHSPSIAQIHQN